MRHHRFTRALLTCAAIALVAAVWIAYDTLTHRFTADPWDEQYAWVDTKYAGIRSHVATNRTDTVDYTAEYLVTANDTVNVTTAQAIDAASTRFQQQINGHRPGKGRRFHFNASYQVTRKIGSLVSIEITTEADTVRNQSTDIHYWTFDLTTGKIITLNDLFGDHANDGKARLGLYIQQAVARKVRSVGRITDNDKITALTSPESLINFLASDNETLQFDYAPGAIADNAMGVISVAIPIGSLDMFMQTPVAAQLFKVQAVTTAPEYTPTIEQKTLPNCEHLKCVALTFDDGPSSNTPKILDSLKAAGAHGTFFMIGRNIIRSPDILKRIRAEGSTLGNHTLNHASLPLLTQPQMIYELTQTNAMIEKITGVKPVYMRPPNGSISPDLPAVLDKTGMTAIMWSVDTRDWSTSDQNLIYNRVVSGAKPGAIIVLHDVRNSTVAALPRIIRALQRNGYTLVSLDELFGTTGVPGKIITNAS